MKILITNSHLLDAHGSEVWTEVVARELMRRGHKVFLYAPADMIGAYHLACLRDIPTIAKEGEWQEGGFDIAIIQHLSVISHQKLWQETIKNTLPDSKRIILICHGAHVEPERPMTADYLKDARYACISQEIADHYPRVDWTIIKQPIDPTWFEIKPRDFLDVPERVLWASHRWIVPQELLQICTQKRIGVFLAGQKPMLPNEVRDLYRQCDLIIGTGRWIYEGMAAGIPCVVADRAQSIGFVTPQNVESFEEFNMTLRHRNASMVDWNRILVHYNPALGPMMREYAQKNYSVAGIVDQLLRLVGEQSFGEIVNKVYS